MTSVADLPLAVSNIPKDLAHLSLMGKLEFLQHEMLKVEQLDVKDGLRHYFADNIYGRELARPAGALVVGRIHKTRHLFILLKGEMSVLTENGMERFTAPKVIVSPAGTKRMTYAHTDCVAIAIIGTPVDDVEEIEQTLFADSEREYLQFVEEQKLLLGEPK